MILYEGEELVVHQAEGDTDYLLVTFVGALATRQATQTFLAETPVRKNRISCLGITSKVDYWYISPETDHVLSLIRNIAAGYSRILLFGMSMGAHAAIAFSRALNADVVFAGAPKWSLDPEECEIGEGYVRDNFRDGMQGMGLRAHQAQGQIYVACDPHDSTDTYHMKKVAEHIPGIHYIPTFRSGHVVATSISGSAAFKTIIDALLSGSPARVNHAVSEARRKNPTNIRYRMREGYARHPLLCYHMLASLYDRADGRFRAVFEDEWLVSSILYRLIRAGYTREAADLFANATSLRLTGRRAHVPRTTTVASDAIAFSIHGYALSWNAERASFHGRTFITPNNTSFLVFCHEAAGEKYASVVINTQRFYIRQDEKRFALTQNREEAGVLRFMQLPSEASVQNGKNDNNGQLVVLRTSQGYACFHPDYNNHMDSPNLLDWEILTLCPLSPGLAGQTVEIPNDNNENVPAISQDEHTELTGTAVRL